MSVIRAIAVFLCGFLSLRVSRAQIIMPGNCPADVKAMSNFDASQYLGRWYEAEKYFFVFEFGGKCITADYSQKEDGKIGVVNKQIGVITGMETKISGQAVQVSRSDEAKLAVSFPSLPYNIAAPYWVVDTDYDSYAVVWSCYEFGLFHTLNVWILTREQNPPVTVLEKAYSVLDKNRISRAHLIRTNQRDCPDKENSTKNL